MDQKLLHKIAKRKEEGTLRSLSSFNGYIDFFSNDYLGLAQVKTPDDIPLFGGTGSRLISGTSKAAIQTENSLALFFSAQAGLIFNSGYDANIGFFSSVPQRGDTVLFDELIHASVRDGIRLGFAKSYSFKHNNIKDLEAKLNVIKGTVYVSIESLYSMDGDFAPLKEIVALCEKYGAYLIVDEAHAVGVFGEKGKGLVSKFNLTNQVFARLVTFGKAYGSHGGLILGSSQLIEYLYNFSRSFIYTTALPPSLFNRLERIVKHVEIDERRFKLQQNIALFRSLAHEVDLLSDELSPIQIVRIGSIERTSLISQNLNNKGIAVKSIFSPTVPVGEERLRICIHSFNSESEITKLVNCLKSV